MHSRCSSDEQRWPRTAGKLLLDRLAHTARPLAVLLTGIRPAFIDEVAAGGHAHADFDFGPISCLLHPQIADPGLLLQAARFRCGIGRQLTSDTLFCSRTCCSTRLSGWRRREELRSFLP
jgi:hypothetical protein